MAREQPHLILAGGGLANGLLALRVAEKAPGTRITMVEAAGEAGGNHTWSFHHGDLDADQHRFIAPMVAHRWAAQQVRFPAYTRTLEAGYLSITSDSFRAHLKRHERIELISATPVREVAPDHLVTATGERLRGTAVIDGSGPRDARGMVLGFQKFVGRELRMDRPHGVDCPVIMDATVSQHDGYRFVYLLPFSDHRLLIEDTCYSDAQDLPEAAFGSRIDAYIDDHGWQTARVEREERGVLPILLAGDFGAFWPESDPVARAGLRAGLFHPVTGYSLPMAMRLADAVAAAWPLAGPGLAALTREHARRFWRDTGFFRRLNRMLFRSGRPDQRYRVLERFYRLPEPLVTNFYAARLTLAEKCRILIGKPPVPVAQALQVFGEASFLQRERDET